MNRKDIEDVVRTKIADMFDIEKSLIHDDSNWIKDFQADSLDAVELIMEIEDALKIDINDEKVEVVVTLSELVDIIEKEIG